MGKVMTICLLVRQAEDGSKQICLAEKRRGFRAGKINGYGGKLLEGRESLLECVLRETHEEAKITLRSVRKVAEIFFHDPEITHECHVYICEDWEGDPTETEEMASPEWYTVEEIPFERMGKADPLWIVPVLSGDRLRASFHYDEDTQMYGNSVVNLEPEEGFENGC